MAKEKIVQQVSRDRCKQETLIFKIMIDLVTKRIFVVLRDIEFLQFSRRKFFSDFEGV